MFEELSYKKLLEKANEIELENKQLKGLIRNFTLLYSSMVEGVCLHEIVFGDDRKAVDYKILDVNPAYEEITQIKKEKAIGRLASDLYGTGNPPYLDIYATVAKSGVPTTFETYFPPMDKHFTISVVSLEREKFATIFFDITDRKKAEEELAEIFTMSLDMICIADINTSTFIRVNPAFIKILGFSEKELLGESFLHFIHPEDIESTAEIVQEKLKKGKQVINFENRYRCKGGGYRWLSWVSHPVPEKGVTYAVARDITSLKEAEAALLESGATLQTIFRAAPIGIGLVTDRILGWVNDTLSKMIGYSRNELEGKSARMMYPSDAEFERVGRVKHPKVLAYGTGSIETQFKHKNGRIIDVLLSSSSILPDDLSGGMIFTVMDITERKRTETALLKSEEKYRELVENINDVIYVTDAEGKLVYISPVIESVTGYTHSEILGQNFSLFIYHEDMPLLIERFQELPSGVIRPTEYRIVTKSGQIKWVRTSSKPVYNESIFTGIRGILTDITESKKIEEDKKKLHGQLQQAQKMEAIGTLAGGIAHDFNNILSAVIGYAELGLNDAEKESSVYRNLHEVLRAAGRAKNLVTQILAFSRQAEQERKPVQVEPIVKEVLKFLRASLPTTIEIRQNIQSDSLIMADPTQIHQILMNLCTNAGHAMRKKGGLLEVKLADIEVEADFAVDYLDLKPGAYLALEVSDNGHGIPGNVMDRIFDPFFTTKEKGEGTGMGLSVVHGIVGSFGGKISVSSEPGQGATFRIYLPVVSKRQETSVETEEILPTGSERILFVDDEPALVNIGKQSLESLGYRVTVRTSSREALELFKAEPHRFDLVITDMTMPNMTGDDLARELIRINPQIPVILCTGYSAQIDQELAMGIGIRAFVSKPMLRREIGETIRKVLDE